MTDEQDRAKQILLDDLADAGLEVRNADVWLLQLPDQRARRLAYPILVDHLERGTLSANTAAAAATHLSRAAARPYWDRIASVFETRPIDWATTTLAGTLAASAGRHQLPELERLFQQNENNRVSVMFVRALLRLDPARWRTYFEEHNKGAVWGVEARAALKGRARND